MKQALKLRVLAELRQGSKSKDQLMKKFGLANPKQLYNAIYQLKSDSVPISRDGDLYFVNAKSDVETVPTSKTIESGQKIVDELRTSRINPAHVDDMLDLFFKATFYKGALEAHVRASKLTSTVKGLLCGHQS